MAIQINSNLKTESNKENRLLYIDNLRIYLTILVIMHHSAITYGAMGSWMYLESSNYISQILLSWFTAINQSFFMGLFFLLSGYFIPSSLSRKGIKEFRRDRLIRLGIPLLFYMFFLSYLCWWMIAVIANGIQISFFAFVVQQIIDVNVAVGPLWFVLKLLLFTFIYLGIYQIQKKRPHSSSHLSDRIELNNRTLIMLALGLGLLTFLVRIVFPSNFEIPLINGLGIQLGYMPQYFVCFIIGILAAQHKWLDKITPKQTKLALGLSIFFSFFLIAFAIALGVFDNYEGPNLSGGFNWVAFVYAMSESFLTVNISIALIGGFKTYFNHQNRVVRALSVNAYTAYIIHPFLVVGVALILHELIIFPLFKWILLSVLAVPLCFLLSVVIRKIPKITRILG